ncbi:hypothetical protein [Paenibacillus sp. FSL P4-0288]|uniref:hypothetical protein n=1 Tax=Paenibacillus sp. FSL P4-0288 TaxID=2921633 RepID=UPI0030F68EA3
MCIKKLKTLIVLNILVLSLLTMKTSVNASGSTLDTEDIGLSIVGEKSDIYYKKITKGLDFTTSLQIENVTDNPITFSVYPSDQIPAIGGGWDFHSTSKQNNLSGSWIKQQEVRNISLGAKKKIVIEYIVNVPKELEYGQYIAALVVTKEMDAVTENANVNGKSLSLVQTRDKAQFRQIVMDYNPEMSKEKLIVPSLAKRLDESGKLILDVSYQNKGTILVKSAGKYYIGTDDGEIIQEGAYGMDSIYVGTTAIYPIELQDYFEEGSYYLKIEGVYGKNKPLNATLKFDVAVEESNKSLDKLEASGSVTVDRINVIWIYLSVILLILLVVLSVFVIILLRRKKDDKNKTEGSTVGITMEEIPQINQEDKT